MLKGEDIVQEIEKRMATTSAASVARNPKSPPGVEHLPAVNIFELDDDVRSTDKRGASLSPVYRRTMTVVLEVWDESATEEVASTTVSTLLEEVLLKLYSGGITLGKRCADIREIKRSRVLRPSVGNHVAGRSITFEIDYTETLSD